MRLIIAVIAATLAFAANANAGTFRDSVGVNVHVSYGDTVYNNVAAMRQAVAALGVGHCRDGLPLSTQAWVKTRMESLPCAMTLIYGAPHLGKSFPSPPANTVLHEGLNEYDYPPRPSEGWLPQLQAHQARLPTPSVAPSFVFASSYPKCACPADYGNGHPYPAGGWETTTHAQNELARATRQPALATEWGYHTETSGWHAPGHPPVTETQQRDRTIAGVLELLKVGWRRVYLYELFDLWSTEHQEHRFGLYRNDGVTAKPAGQALGYWLNSARLGDSRPVEAGESWGWAAAQTGPAVRYSEWVNPDGSHTFAIWRTADGTGVTDVAISSTVPGNYTFSGYRASTGHFKTAVTTRRAAFSVGNEPVLVRVRAG